MSSIWTYFADIYRQGVPEGPPTAEEERLKQLLDIDTDMYDDEDLKLRSLRQRLSDKGHPLTEEGVCLLLL